MSVLGLLNAPRLIDRNMLRPHGLAQRGDYATLVTSGFVHADLAHLLFNSFRWIDVSEALLDALSEPDRGRIRHANAALFKA